MKRDKPIEHESSEEISARHDAERLHRRATGARQPQPRIKTFYVITPTGQRFEMESFKVAALVAERYAADEYGVNVWQRSGDGEEEVVAIVSALGASEPPHGDGVPVVVW